MPNSTIIDAIQTLDRDPVRDHIEQGEHERAEILKRFPIEAWQTLPLERYVLGLDDSDVYSWWIEFGSLHLGSMAGGTARKHLIYWSKKNSSYYFPQTYSDVEQAWSAVRGAFISAFELGQANDWNAVDEIESFHGAGALRVKTMHVYFPDHILPITSDLHLKHFLTQLGVVESELKGLRRIALNRKLLETLRAIPELANWKTNELERLLYHWADPRDTRRIVKIAPGENAEFWQECLQQGFICVGWDDVGDLNEFESLDDLLERFTEKYAALYNDHRATIKRKAKEVWTLSQLEPGDIVVANKGKSEILALGEVQDPGYVWRPARAKFRHTVNVKWDTSYAQKIEPQERWGFVTVAPVSTELYQQILKKAGASSGGNLPPPLPIEPRFKDIEDALLRKGQVILYGPPGTGKTFHARQFAVWWLLKQRGDANAQRVLADKGALVDAENQLKTVQVSRKVWWVVANPKEWSWEQLFRDRRVAYRFGRLQRNYPLVQPGDLVVGYQSTPDKRIVALARVTKGISDSAEEPTIEIEPLHRLNNGPTYAELVNDAILQKSEPMRFRNQGTLFALTQDEADYLLGIIGEREPEVQDALKAENDIGALTWLTFHPSYSYEDFIEGFRPVDTGSGLALKLEDGVFKQLCRTAQTYPKKTFLLVIDEINRANLAKVFGELITLLEKDKRGKLLTLPQSKEAFTIPPNLYLLGTMNTADRSIRLLDAALRRRFAFIEIMPDEDTLSGASVNGLALDEFLSTLNQRIAARQGREKQIGHSYLLDGEQPLTVPEDFCRVFRQEILPLLQEYCYDDYKELASYIGDALVDSEKQRLKEEVLNNDNQLIEAFINTLRQEGSA